jgi:hypothetical protein
MSAFHGTAAVEIPGMDVDPGSSTDAQVTGADQHGFRHRRNENRRCVSGLRPRLATVKGNRGFATKRKDRALDRGQLNGDTRLPVALTGSTQRRPNQGLLLGDCKNSSQSASIRARVLDYFASFLSGRGIRFRNRRISAKISEMGNASNL